MKQWGNDLYCPLLFHGDSSFVVFTMTQCFTANHWHKGTTWKWFFFCLWSVQITEASICFFFLYRKVRKLKPLSPSHWHLDRRCSHQGPLWWLCPQWSGRSCAGTHWEDESHAAFFNFPAMASVQDSAGQMEMRAGRAGDISRPGPQHLRHDVRRSLPEVGQQGVWGHCCHQRERAAEAGSVWTV